MGNVISLKTTQYILYQEKKIPTVMITISTDIHKTNNHVSLQTADDPICTSYLLDSCCPLFLMFW